MARAYGHKARPRTRREIKPCILYVIRVLLVIGFEDLVFKKLTLSSLGTSQRERGEMVLVIHSKLSRQLARVQLLEHGEHSLRVSSTSKLTSGHPEHTKVGIQPELAGAHARPLYRRAGRGSVIGHQYVRGMIPLAMVFCESTEKDSVGAQVMFGYIRALC